MIVGYAGNIFIRVGCHIASNTFCCFHYVKELFSVGLPPQYFADFIGSHPLASRGFFMACLYEQAMPSGNYLNLFFDIYDNRKNSIAKKKPVQKIERFVFIGISCPLPFAIPK